MFTYDNDTCHMSSGRMRFREKETTAETKAETTAETTGESEAAEDHSDLKLTIYSAVFDDETHAICERFQEETGIKTDCVVLGGGETRQEFRQKRITRQLPYGSAARQTRLSLLKKRDYCCSMNPRMQHRLKQNIKMPITTGQVFILAMLAL